MTQLTCCKAYDIRGQLGAELNEDIAYRIGRAYAQFLDAKKVVGLSGNFEGRHLVMRRSE